MPITIKEQNICHSIRPRGLLYLFLKGIDEAVEAYTLPFTIAPTRSVSVGRVEIYDADGHYIGLTNPLYPVRADDPATLPQERLYTE